MLEIVLGVYTSPDITAGIREWIWDVLTGWYFQFGQCSIAMTYRDSAAVSDQSIRKLGEAPKDIVDGDGVYLVEYE